VVIYQQTKSMSIFRDIPTLREARVKARGDPPTGSTAPHPKSVQARVETKDDKDETKRKKTSDEKGDGDGGGDGDGKRQSKVRISICVRTDFDWSLVVPDSRRLIES
jgi:hypothetical protein